MKTKLKKPMIVRGFFFAGRPEENANLVCRMPNMFGYYLLVFVNTYLQNVPKDGEEWRFALDEVDMDPDMRTARATCIPLQKMSDISKVEIGPRSMFHGVRPALNPEEASERVKVAFAPPPVKKVRTNHRAQERSRQASMKPGNKTGK